MVEVATVVGFHEGGGGKMMVVVGRLVAWRQQQGGGAAGMLLVVTAMVTRVDEDVVARWSLRRCGVEMVWRWRSGGWLWWRAVVMKVATGVMEMMVITVVDLWCGVVIVELATVVGCHEGEGGKMMVVVGRLVAWRQQQGGGAAGMLLVVTSMVTRVDEEVVVRWSLRRCGVEMEEVSGKTKKLPGMSFYVKHYYNP
nr:hypothetical protein [Tanacetum cinerariifolium]